MANRVGSSKAVKIVAGSAAGVVVGGTVGLATVSFVSGWEGRENTPYLDIVGVTTVCDGHTGADIEWRPYSDEECDKLLAGDLGTHSSVMLRLITVPLSQGETIAYTSLTFNIGVGAFSRSTLLVLLNSGDRKGACKQLLLFRKAGGKVVKGLVNRRMAEYKLCITPDIKVAHVPTFQPYPYRLLGQYGYLSPALGRILVPRYSALAR